MEAGKRTKCRYFLERGCVRRASLDVVANYRLISAWGDVQVVLTFRENGQTTFKRCQAIPELYMDIRLKEKKS